MFVRSPEAILYAGMSRSARNSALGKSNAVAKNVTPSSCGVAPSAPRTARGRTRAPRGACRTWRRSCSRSRTACCRSRSCRAHGCRASGASRRARRSARPPRTGPSHCSRDALVVLADLGDHPAVRVVRDADAFDLSSRPFKTLKGSGSSTGRRDRRRPSTVLPAPHRESSRHGRVRPGRAAPEARVAEQALERGAQRGRVARRDEQARLAVDDQVGEPADGASRRRAGRAPSPRARRRRSPRGATGTRRPRPARSSAPSSVVRDEADRLRDAVAQRAVADDDARQPLASPRGARGRPSPARAGRRRARAAGRPARRPRAGSSTPLGITRTSRAPSRAPPSASSGDGADHEPRPRAGRGRASHGARRASSTSVPQTWRTNGFPVARGDERRTGSSARGRGRRRARRAAPRARTRRGTPARAATSQGCARRLPTIPSAVRDPEVAEVGAARRPRPRRPRSRSAATASATKTPATSSARARIRRRQDDDLTRAHGPSPRPRSPAEDERHREREGQEARRSSRTASSGRRRSRPSSRRAPRSSPRRAGGRARASGSPTAASARADRARRRRAGGTTQTRKTAKSDVPTSPVSTISAT